MEFLDKISFLYTGFAALVDWRYVVMWLIGGILIYLAIKKDMEPTLLLPLGFGTILVNIPFSGAVGDAGALTTLFKAGISNELFPLILFIGIGAMIDFTPLLANPKLMIFGAAAQFGIFFTLCLASMFFPINDAASIGIIGAADGPTAIVVAQALDSAVYRGNYGRGVFVYGTCTDHPAAGHQNAHYEKRASYPYAVCQYRGFAPYQNSFPDCDYYHRRYCRSRIGFSYRLLDVR